MPAAQPVPLAVAATVALALAAAVWAQGSRIVALAAIGIFLGATLHISSFGFASAYRRLLEGRGVRAVRAQILMIAAASFPLAHFGREMANREADRFMYTARGLGMVTGIPVALKLLPERIRRRSR